MRRIHDPDGWTRYSPNIVGWLGIAGMAVAGVLGVTGALSLFRFGLDEEPLYWWSLRSGFAVMSMFFVLGWSLALSWLIPRSGNPKLIAKWSLVAAPIILIVCFLHDARSGVALYPGGLTYRQAGIFSPKYFVAYGDLEAVETGCVFERERGRYSRPSTKYPSAIYNVRTPAGDWINLSHTALRWSDRFDWRGWLAVVSDVDQTISKAGGERQGIRHATNGRLLYDVGCVEAFGGKFDETERLQWQRVMRLDGDD